MDRHILLPTDGSELSARALREGTRLTHPSIPVLVPR